MGFDLFKPTKLKITAFEDEGRKAQAPIEPFEAMFNPASFTQTHSIPWQSNHALGASDKTNVYAGSNPQSVSLTLTLDGTGVDQMGIINLFGTKTVADRVKAFHAVTIQYNGKIHQPYYLIAEWGVLIFRCRLSRVTTKYTLFDREGMPLRAELGVDLISDQEPAERKKEEGNKSPDVTHARVVRAGDTLPLLTKEIYGSSKSYMDVARFNNLDDFRMLIPGQILHFPPLKTFLRGAAGQGVTQWRR